MIVQSSRNYFNTLNQSYMDKRNFGIRTIRSLCSNLNFRDQTFFLAVYFLDFVYTNNKHYLNLEHAAVSCVILAGKLPFLSLILFIAKFEENDPMVPALSRIPKVNSGSSSYSYKNYYLVDDLAEVEVKCLKMLDFTLSHVTAYHLIRNYLNMGIITKEECSQIEKTGIQGIERIVNSNSFISKSPGLQPRQNNELDLRQRAFSGIEDNYRSYNNYLNDYNDLKDSNDYNAYDRYDNNHYEKYERKKIESREETTALEKIYNLCFDLLEVCIKGMNSNV